MKKIKEFREKTEKELVALIEAKKKEINDFRFKLAKGKAKNVKFQREARKDIARILTILKEKENKK